jgi:hypothetical protein
MFKGDGHVYIRLHTKQMGCMLFVLNVEKSQGKKRVCRTLLRGRDVF